MNLYYIVYEYDDIDIYGEMYIQDTGFGIVELGVIENDNIFDKEYYFIPKYSLEGYINSRNFMNILYILKVL